MVKRQSRVQQVAKLIRRTYIDERCRLQLNAGQAGNYRPGPRWDGGVDELGRTHESVWEKLAKVLIAREVDPVDFIRSQFFTTSSFQAPLPNQLISDKAFVRYATVGAEIEDEIKDAFRFQRSLFRSELVVRRYLSDESDETELLIDVLMDVDLALTALFRYVAARRLKLPRIAKHFREAAISQFCRRPDVYVRCWGKWIPRSLRDRVGD